MNELETFIIDNSELEVIICDLNTLEVFLISDSELEALLI
jgi:hypothetical protein